MSKLSLLGDRVAVTMLDEAWAGKIALPENRHKMFLMGRVVAWSAANLPSKAAPSKVASNGDIVLFQINMSNSGFKLDGQQANVLHPCDVLAKLDKPTSDFAGFTPLGNWVLVSEAERVKKTSGILLPDTAVKDPAETRYLVSQVGAWVNSGSETVKINPGSEVIVERNRLNPISIGGRDYGYIDKSFVHGVVSE